MTTVLRGGRIITGTSDDQKIIDTGIVVVNGAQLAAVGPEGHVAIPRGAEEVIDVKGRTILPGLIDVHTHICHLTDAESRAGITAQTVAASMIRAVENIRRTTASGVTTVRDVGSKHAGIFALRQAIDSGELVGPRILPAGAAIAMTGGHGYNSVSDEADGVDAVRAMARQQLKLGAECIKVMATGGAGTPGEQVTDSQLTVEEMAAAVDEAHKKGKAAAAHATYPKGVLDALAAGVDTIEHGLILDDACVQQLVATGRYLVPTLEVYQRIAGLEVGVNSPLHYMVSKAQQIVGQHKESFRIAVDAGVKIATGTDAGGTWWPLGDLGYELERMVDFGFEPLEAIMAATRNAAEALRMVDQLGTLEPGKFADLIVVDGNPFDDITTIRNTWLVMRDGKVQFAA